MLTVIAFCSFSRMLCREYTRLYTEKLLSGAKPPPYLIAKTQVTSRYAGLKHNLGLFLGPRGQVGFV